MGKITLEQLLQYFDEHTDPEYRIQIVMPNEEWDCATEMWVGSELLKPFMKYFVQEIDYEESYFDKKPLIRVSLDEEE